MADSADPMAPVLFSRRTEPVDPSTLVAAPPDFVGVGAMKSGTTWLQAQLIDHPEVFDIGQKELHHFDWFFDAEFGEEHARGYVERFARPAGMLAGEFTPRYMVDVWTPPLLASVAPDARIIVLLRDPVSRIDSHMRWPNTGQPMLPMFKAAEALNRCHYHLQLTHLLGSFARSQVLVLQYERIAADPRAVYMATLEHIGVRDLDHVPAALHERVLENPERSSGLRPETRRAIVDYLRPEIERLTADFGESIDVSLWPDFAR